jgi:uncharacterized damage-inducible protein DinB
VSTPTAPTPTLPPLLAEQSRIADETLTAVEDLLRTIDDADLHRADPDGGWTGATIVSHMTLAGLLWVADVTRLSADPELDSFYREEIGHDATGAVPPTAAEAADEVASLRRTMLTTMPMHTEELLAREVSITTLGRRTVAEWLPVIVGHVVHHRDQLHDVLRSRGCLPARFEAAAAEGGAA